jgi:hypothetical protein
MTRKIILSSIILLALASAVVCGLMMRKTLDVNPNSASSLSGLDCGHWAILRTGELLGVPISWKQPQPMWPWPHLL